MAAVNTQDIDAKISSLRSIIEAAKRDIEILQRAKEIILGGVTSPELPFDDQIDHGRKSSTSDSERLGPTGFVEKRLKADSTKKWAPGTLAKEFGVYRDSPNTRKAIQDNRLAIHGVLKALLARKVVARSEPDERKVRVYWWVGKS